MKSLKKIKKEIVTTAQVRSIVEVYEEVSAIKMRNIRDDILNSREFLEKLADLSAEVGSDLSEIVGKNLKSAAVYISAGSGMYGDLPEKVFLSFIKHIEKEKIEPIIFGKQGKIYVQKYKKSLKYSFFDMDEEKDVGKILELVSRVLSDYSNVLVFYGKFKSVVSQDVAIQALAGDYFRGLTKEEKKEMTKRQYKFIYEPDVDSVSQKFSSDIKMSTLEGFINENNLAKYASRLMYLDQAYENIRKRMAVLENFKQKEIKKEEDKKQQERIKRLWV